MNTRSSLWGPWDLLGEMLVECQSHEGKTGKVELTKLANTQSLSAFSGFRQACQYYRAGQPLLTLSHPLDCSAPDNANASRIDSDSSPAFSQSCVHHETVGQRECVTHSSAAHLVTLRPSFKQCAGSAFSCLHSIKSSVLSSAVTMRRLVLLTVDFLAVFTDEE